MMRGRLWATISLVALTSCGGAQPPPAEPATDSPGAPDAPSADSAASSTPEDSEPTEGKSSKELMEEWAKHANDESGEGADPFPEDVVGFALGMDEAQVRQVCAKAKGKIVASQPLRCTFDSALGSVFKVTALWLSKPRQGWLDGGVSVKLDDAGRACGISVDLSGRNVGSVVPPSDLLEKLGIPVVVRDDRQTRVARWQWLGEKHAAFAGWSHHLPSYQGSGGQRQWVSYCQRTSSDCRTFCSYLD